MRESDSFFISVIDEETLKIVSKPNVKMRYSEYETLNNIYKELLPGVEKYKFLIVLQEGFTIEKNPIDFIKHKLNPTYRKAEAYVIISPIFKVFVQVGKKISGFRHPIKIFNNEKEAQAWLLQQ
ncbi:MAG: hypothetical protein MK078_12850 [Crocinitomicaceae bacterium]|nr:hypothetical protein [Crocinitomicaceae bacterium]